MPLDQNGIRGRACTLVSHFLTGLLQLDVIEKAIAETDPSVSPEEIDLVKQEIGNIAQELSLNAHIHRAVELGQKKKHKQK